MTPTDTTDRADATVWLPLLSILGGVAERVARQRPDPGPTDLDPQARTSIPGGADGRTTRRVRTTGDGPGQGGRP